MSLTRPLDEHARSLSAPSRPSPTTIVLLGVVLAFAAYRFFEEGLYPFYKEVGGHDFAVFHYASRQILLGTPLYLHPGEIGSYIYPPTLAILLLPLAPIENQRIAMVPFVILSMLAVVGTVALLLQAFASRDRWSLGAALLALVLAAFPVHMLLRQGQVDSFTLILMVASLVLAWRGREHWSAAALAGAISLKVSPGILVLFYAWKGKYRLAAESLGFTLLILLLGGVVVGPQNLVTFVTGVLPRIGSEGHGYQYNQSTHALLMRLFAANDFTIPVADIGMPFVVAAANVIALIALAATLVFTGRDWPQSGPLYVVQAGAFVALEVVSVSLSWQMHHVWMLVPIVGLILLLQQRATGVPWWLVLLVGMGILGFASGPEGPPFEYGRFANGWLSILQSHNLAGAFLLLGASLAASQRERRLQAVALEASRRTSHGVERVAAMT